MKAFTFILFLFVSTVSAQELSYQWVKSLGGIGQEEISYDLVLDGRDYVYITGTFEGIGDFDPGPELQLLTSAGKGDIFVCKLDTNGNLIWIKQFGAEGDDRGRAIKLDKHGNIFIIGMFGATVDFDPGSEQYHLTAKGSEDVFLCKLDPEGNFLWARGFGGSTTSVYGYDVGYSLALDGEANVYATGHFRGTVDFDPGLGEVYLSSKGSEDIFIIKMSAAGDFRWAKTIGGTKSDFGISIDVGPMGNIYATGHIRDQLRIETEEGWKNFDVGENALFLAKINDLGKVIWFQCFEGSGTSSGNAVSIRSNYIYLLCTFEGKLDWESLRGTNQFIESQMHDVLVLKIDLAGKLIWAKLLGGPESQTGADIQVDGKGDIYILGLSYGTADFDPGPGTANLISAGKHDVFLCKIDQNGNYITSKRMGGIGFDAGMALDIDNVGNLYVTGFYQKTAIFDQTMKSSNITDTKDIFISKLVNVLNLKLDDHDWRIGISDSIGLSQGLKMAIEVKKKTIGVYNDKKQVEKMAMTYREIGWLFWSQKIPDSAFKYLNISMEIFQAIDDLDQIIYNQKLLADWYYSLQYYRRARTAYGQTIEMLKRTDNQKLLAKVYCLMAKNEINNKQLISATQYAKTGFEIAFELEEKGIMLQSVYLLTQIYEGTGEVQNLIDSKELYWELRESLKIEDNVSNNHIINIGIELDSAIIENALLKKDQELKESQMKGQKRMVIFVLALIVLIILIAILVVRFLQLRIKQERKHNREQLDLFTQSLIQKNNLALELNQKLKQNQNFSRGVEEQKNLDQLFEIRILTDEDWNRFKRFFDQTNPGFLIQLRQIFPELSPAEQRLFMLIRLELQTQEIASVLGIAPDSVRKTRKRLRKKIHLPKSESLEAFVMGFN